MESTRKDLAEVAFKAAEETANKLLEQMGLKKEIITKSEVRRLYGRQIAKLALNSPDLDWFPLYAKGRGKGNEVFCQRADFSRWLFSTNRETDE